MKTCQFFAVLSGNVKTAENIVFHPAAPVLNYHQKASNSCCLSSLEFDFHGIGDNRGVTTLVNRIEESLTL